MEFRLPDRWRPVDPDSAGMPAAAFVAARQEHGDSGTSLAIAGRYRSDEATLADLADESVQRLRASAVVDVVARSEAGSERAPTLTQLLRLETTGNQPRDVLRQQAYVAMHDVAEPSRRVVLELTLTTTPDQFPGAAADFREFLRTLRPVPGEVLPAHRRVSAETLEIAAQADDAPAELRSLARAVRDGRTSWAEIVAGESEDLPELQRMRDESQRRTARLLERWGVPAAAPSSAPASPAAAARSAGVIDR